MVCVAAPSVHGCGSARLRAVNPDQTTFAASASVPASPASGSFARMSPGHQFAEPVVGVTHGTGVLAPPVMKTAPKKSFSMPPLVSPSAITP